MYKGVESKLKLTSSRTRIKVPCGRETAVRPVCALTAVTPLGHAAARGFTFSAGEGHVAKNKGCNLTC